MKNIGFEYEFVKLSLPAHVIDEIEGLARSNDSTMSAIVEALVIDAVSKRYRGVEGMKQYVDALIAGTDKSHWQAGI